MANIFPNPLPNNVLHDKRRAAEIKVYNAFKKQLNDKYYVFYSSPWLGTNQDGSEIDGEADFIIAHQDYGILVIEVKGGRIRIDENNQWTSKDRDNITFRIKNPVDQARTSKHQLLKKIKNNTTLATRNIWITHGVILPDNQKLNKALRPDMPIELFAFNEDMDTLENYIHNRFNENGKSTKSNNFGLDGVLVLKELITKPIILKVKLSSDVNDDLEQIQLLTDDQVLILRELEDNKRMAITGAAGTGKTILAIQKAIIMAEEKKKVLLLCFNRPLSINLKDQTSEYRNIDSKNFHQFCIDCFKKSGDKKYNSILMEELSDKELSELMIDAFIESGQKLYDAIIIDEGQDFSHLWLIALQSVIKDAENGVLYIFYDDNQNIRSQSTDYIKSLPIAKHKLLKNIRNTKKIFSEAEKYYSGSYVMPVGPDGVDINWSSLNLDDMNYQIRQKIDDSLGNDGFYPEQISILFQEKKCLDSFMNDKHLNRYKIVDSENIQSGHITVDTIRRFKGLESHVVFLIMTNVENDIYELFYTGITRAQIMLVVFMPDWIKRKIYDDLI